MNRIAKIHELGQSLWYDNIKRSLLTSGVLASLISAGDIRGVTSNPSIFNNAIANSSDYNNSILTLSGTGMSDEQIFYNLAVEDIRTVADLFFPLYQETGGRDGFVSLEVSPLLANDTQGTIADARRLWKWVDRPNLMVKIPATPAGLPAIHTTLSEGININVTLIFSINRYKEVMEAYISALEDRVGRGLRIDKLASVASFFVSRFDTKVDQILEKQAAPIAASLAGKAAIANVRLAYSVFKETFSAERYLRLEKSGGRPQRPLWASTSTKNPAYRDVMYIEELIGPDTVNTAPPATIDAFRDHGEACPTLNSGLPEARHVMNSLENLGISIDTINQELENEGVSAFSDAYTALLNAISTKRQILKT